VSGASMSDCRDYDLETSFRDARLVRLARDAVARMHIDLAGMRVLTEAATGPFASTALLAALGGASDVVAVTRDSSWGTASEAFRAVGRLVEHCGVGARIRFHEGYARDVAAGCDVVTNLGFVRPIDRAMIEVLGTNAAVALMWEPWEFRAGEIDVVALRDRGVPIVATAEAHADVRTFDYLGPTVARLLLNGGIEVMRSRLLVLGSDPFGNAVAAWLAAAGAVVAPTDPERWAASIIDAAMPFDALVVVEHRDHRSIVDSRHHAALDVMRRSGSPIVRVAGVVDHHVLRAHGVVLLPDVDVEAGFMAVTTAHVGARSVVDLHAAGLKAASLVVQARRVGASCDEAVAAAVASGYGLALEAGA
jgi:hypothetical protein